MNSSSSHEVTLSLALSPPSIPLGGRDIILNPQERGILLIQLLLTCATHASSGNLHRADACLRQISHFSLVSGDSMQRLAAWFASALAIRLVKRWPGIHKTLNHTQPTKPLLDLTLISQALPYLGFAYDIVSRTLIRSMSEERVIHIIDLGSGDVNLWVPLIQKFALLPSGPPFLKITCVHNNKVVLEKLGFRLVKEAEKFDMPFQFSPINVNLRDLSIEMVKVKLGESLAFVSILNLHVLLVEDDTMYAQFGVKKSMNGIRVCKRMDQFLAMLRSMSPKVLFLVEQEANHNLNRLSERFIEGLHYYSAVFDSIDAMYKEMWSEERFVLEEMFGRAIENMVACEGLEREERYERYERWAMRFSNGGWKPVRMWYDCMEEEGKRMAAEGGWNGCKIVSERGSLMICWHERPLFAVSAWIC